MVDPVVPKVRLLRVSVPGLDEVPNHVLRTEIQELERQLEQLDERDDLTAIVARLELLRTALEPDYYSRYHDHSCYVLDIPTVMRHSVVVPLADVPDFAEPCGHCSPPRPAGMPRPGAAAGRSPRARSAGNVEEAQADTVVVEVGATARVRDDAGKTYVWTIVSGRSDPKSGKVSATTPVAKALLGHRVGDVVAVVAGRARRYTVEGIDPAPAKPAATPSPPAAPANQRPIPVTAGIVVYGRAEEGDYEDWVRLNRGGYVLKRRDTATEGYMLHLAECTHLALTPGTFTMRTAHPRRCSRSHEALIQWCRAETGSPPHKCSSCF